MAKSYPVAISAALLSMLVLSIGGIWSIMAQPALAANASNSTPSSTDTQHQATNEVHTYNTSTLRKDQVFTPFGVMNATDVHGVPDGTLIDVDKLISDAKAHGATTTHQNHNHFPPGTAYNEYAEWDSSSSMTSFHGSWKVPSKPIAQYCDGTGGCTNQVAYLFIGSETSNTNIIIQPVLAYGYPGYTYQGCNCWTIASWMYIASTNQVYFSTPKTVSVGDTLYGTMDQYTTTIWTINLQDTTSSVSSGMTINTNSYFNRNVVALETGNLPAAQCDFLPGNTPFTNLFLNGGSLTPSWSQNYPNQYCSMQVQVISSSAVTLHTLS